MVNAWNAWALRPLVPTAVTASNTAAGYSAANVLNDYGGVVWKTDTGAATRTLTFDFGTSTPMPDAVLFFGCTGAVTAWTLTVEAADSADFLTNYWSGGAAAQFLAGSTMPSHGRGVGLWTTAAPPASGRRYWRFTFGSLASAAVTVARIMLGTRLTLERNFDFGAAFGVRDLGSADWSAQGNLLRRRAARLRTLGVSFSNVRKDEVVAKIQPLIELSAGQEAIAIVTDPTADADRMLRCWGGIMVGDMGTVQRTAAGWAWRVNLVDLIAIPRAA